MANEVDLNLKPLKAKSADEKQKYLKGGVVRHIDVTKNPEPPEPTEEWRPRSEPSNASLLRQSAGDLATTPLRLLASVFLI